MTDFQESHLRQVAGTVKWFDADRGFGFMKPDPDLSSDDAMPDVFFHRRQLVATGVSEVGPGTRLVCEVEMINGRPRAARVIDVVDHGVLGRLEEGERMLAAANKILADVSIVAGQLHTILSELRASLVPGDYRIEQVDAAMALILGDRRVD
jgi:cold shock CspA family protein